MGSPRPTSPYDGAEDGDGDDDHIDGQCPEAQPVDDHRRELPVAGQLVVARVRAQFAGEAAHLVQDGRQLRPQRFHRGTVRQVPRGTTRAGGGGGGGVAVRRLLVVGDRQSFGVHRTVAEERRRKVDAGGSRRRGRPAGPPRSLTGAAVGCGVEADVGEQTGRLPAPGGPVRQLAQVLAVPAMTPRAHLALVARPRHAQQPRQPLADEPAHLFHAPATHTHTHTHTAVQQPTRRRA